MAETIKSNDTGPVRHRRREFKKRSDLGFFRGYVQAGDAPEGNAFTQIASTLVNHTPDRTQLAGSIQPGNRTIIRSQYLGPGIPPGPSLGVSISITEKQ
jgi:hypothetical protein